MKRLQTLTALAFTVFVTQLAAEQKVDMSNPVLQEFVSAQALAPQARITQYAAICDKYKDIAVRLPRMVQVSCLKRLSVLQGMSVATDSQIGLLNASQIEVAVQAYFSVLVGE